MKNALITNACCTTPTHLVHHGLHACRSTCASTHPPHPAWAPQTTAHTCTQSLWTMPTHLVHHGLDACSFQQLLHLSEAEIAHTQGLDQACIHQRLHRSPVQARVTGASGQLLLLSNTYPPFKKENLPPSNSPGLLNGDRSIVHGVLGQALGVGHPGQGPVHEVQIDVLHTQIAQGGLQGRPIAPRDRGGKGFGLSLVTVEKLLPGWM